MKAGKDNYCSRRGLSNKTTTSGRLPTFMNLVLRASNISWLLVFTFSLASSSPDHSEVNWQFLSRTHQPSPMYLITSLAYGTYPVLHLYNHLTSSMAPAFLVLDSCTIWAGGSSPLNQDSSILHHQAFSSLLGFPRTPARISHVRRTCGFNAH